MSHLQDLHEVILGLQPSFKPYLTLLPNIVSFLEYISSLSMHVISAVFISVIFFFI